MAGKPVALKGFNPTVLLSDHQWIRVVAALEQRGTIADRKIAERISGQLGRHGHDSPKGSRTD